VGDILHEQKKHDAAERARDLAERKRRALAEAASRREHLLEGSDDDGGLEVIGGDKDMHVVAEEEAGERRAIKAKHIRPSEGRKRQLLLGRVRAADVGKGKGVIQTETAVGRLRIVESQSELNRMMAIRVQRTNREVTRRKEEEWTKRGGKTGVMQDTGLQVKDVLKAYAKKGLKAKEEGEEMDLDGEATGGSDEEWTPDMRGSASPSPDHKDNTDAQSEEEDHEIESEKRLLDDGKLTDADEEAADQAKMRPRAPRHSTTRPRAILDSDQEDDENENPHWSGRPHKNDLVLNSSAEENVNSTPVHQMPGIIHRGSMSSFDEPTEDENENDKENNTRLMYDKSEDKENKAVVRHSLGSLTRLPLSRVETLYSLDGTRRGLSTSPSGVRVAGDEIGGEQSRTPFKELLEDDDDPFISQPRTTFAARLQEASLSSPSITPEPLVFGGGNLGFSQSDNADENEPFGPQPSSKPKSPNQDNGGISPKPLTLLKSGSGPFSQFLSEDQVRFSRLGGPYRLIFCACPSG
jgi:mediator of replication checkpoint protein 1